MTKKKWKVHIDKEGQDWEVSVINSHGMDDSWGWMSVDKLLVGVSDGMSGYAIEWVYEGHIRLAKELCDKLNSGETIDLSWANGPDEDDEDDWDDWYDEDEEEDE